MKKLTLTNFAFVLFVAFALVFTGCNNCTDDCNDRGICIDGTCDCDPGYEGEACETESRTKMLGTWTVTESCDTGNDSYIITVTNGTNVNEIRITNFFDSFSNPVVATVDENAITIANQDPDNDDFTVSGSGNFTTNNTITLNYTIKDELTGATSVCSATLVK